MARGADQPYQALVQHPVEKIDRFLDDFSLEPAWVGIVGGPYVEDGEIVVSYNVRTIDGPYRGVVGADFDYRTAPDSGVTLEEVYPAQVDAIQEAFPEAATRFYVPEVWQE